MCAIDNPRQQHFYVDNLQWTEMEERFPTTLNLYSAVHANCFSDTRDEVSTLKDIHQ